VTALWLALALSASATPAVEVRLDPRVELAAALELLGPGPGPAAFRENGPYGNALKDGVSRCAGHPAVESYRSLRAKARPDWPAQALTELTRCLDDGLAVKPLEPCTRSALAAAAADFASSCGFPAALAAAEKHVAPAVKGLADAAGKEDVLAAFRAYTGLEPGPSRVAPSPQMRPGVFWNGLVPQGASSFSVIVARSPEGDGFPWNGVPVEVWHENGHGLLDGRLPSSSPPKGVDVKGCYESWPQCAREHLAQGLALRLAKGGRKNPRLPLHAKAAGALAAFEKDRAKYPDLLAFYPAWFAALGAGEAAAEAAPEKPSASAPEPELADALALAAKDEAAGRAALEALLERRPNDGGALLSMAVLQRRRDKAAAAALADRAVAAGRGAGGWLLPDALSTRASWRREDGDAAGARKDLEEALAAAPLDWPRRDETRAALGR
jgi:hypothetical protein